jgi:hypothetical protein
MHTPLEFLGYVVGAVTYCALVVKAYRTLRADWYKEAPAYPVTTT